MALEIKEKEVLNTCSHYEAIVNYSFKEGDILTKHLIEQYSTGIFDIDSRDLGKTNQLKVIDIVMHEYIMDMKFQKYVKEHISFEDVTLDDESLMSHDLMMILVKLYNQYRKKKEEALEQTLWL